MKVCKFGGTSMASAESIRKVADIINADAERRFVVVSAPGKRDSNDIKITDSLYASFAMKNAEDSYQLFDAVVNRYLDLVKELEIDIDIMSTINVYRAKLTTSDRADSIVAMGEHLSAMILASVLKWDFVDARQLIKFDTKGNFNSEYTNDICGKVLSKYDHAVIPGFYGQSPSGRTKVFSRGGSDITGAIVARAMGADIYENWTDVSGCFVADPRVVKNPKVIRYMSYSELRELSYMGASVLHPDSVFPVRIAKIPINIRNTFSPEDAGTMIVDKVTEHDRLVTGIAGKKNFTSILVEKDKMNSEVGFTRRLLSVLEQYDISFEHLPSGIDTMTVVISDSEIKGRIDDVVKDIREAVGPDYIEVQDNLALIATVGHGMSYKPGTAARLFSALSRYGINIRMIDQGSSEMNIILAVRNEDFDRTVNAIYEEFIN
ncbi:MAG: aspartate kinase [Clostridia bacterium]|nr:aspartate kinase [Clostridia bacterium]